MEHNKIDDLCKVLKTFPNNEKDIVKVLQRLCNKYENEKKEIYEIPTVLQNKRIKKEKETGRWEKIEKLKDFYINEHPSEEHVYERYINISKFLAESMVLNYKEHINAFDLYFETGIFNELFKIPNY